MCGDADVRFDPKQTFERVFDGLQVSRGGTR
jgi:hypothetical protein